MVKKHYVVRNKKRGGTKNMDAAAVKFSSGTRARRGNALKSLAASLSLMMDRDAAKKIKQAEEDIKTGKTRSLRDILKDG
ncbi:hypothetical protein L7E55_02390 [Pelotomaculum isophthalicicum JI]|uniref:Uncharacterized protein n=1 Tax=Pelotomaculum isophthalicicum JI TaxID=947010 RepID=A0A9X4H4Z5_9FIRM|nr:hypothetical protein [Pelotomaculum isophthalicicum]MDF9407214.1 hypothetical protein [Pelotomaculum isophthalicicum JI]